MKTTHTFKLHGRDWTLYRRGTGRRDPAPSTPWSYRLTVDGKRVLVSTRTAHLETAILKAKARINAELRGEVEEVKVGRKVKSTLTVDEVCALYTSATLVRPKTAQGNALSLQRVLRIALDRDDVGQLTVDVIDAQLAAKFLAKRQGREKPDYGRTLSPNAGANSALRQAQGVFAARHRHIWDEVGLPAGIEGFVKAKHLKEADPRYVPIPEAALVRLDAAVEGLRESQPDLWVINRLIRLCGLRASEVKAARTDWLMEHGGRLYLEIVSRPGEFVPKGHQGRVLVPGVLEPVFRKLLAEAEEAGEPKYLVAGSVGVRHNLIYRTHSVWLRQFLGAARRKTNHELRKHAGSLVALKFNSWEAAARFLREDLETAKNHYLELLQPVGLEVEDLTYEAGPRKRVVVAG